jgi:hypothetical protein
MSDAVQEKRRKSLPDVDVARLRLTGTPRTVYYTLRALVGQGRRFKLDYDALVERVKVQRAELLLAVRHLRDVGLINATNRALVQGEIPAGEEVSLG